MKVITIEQLIEKLNVDVYAITLIKFLLNKRRIMFFFNKAAERDFELRGYKYKIDHSDCVECNEKKDKGYLCRQHTSVDRVMNAKTVLYDLDSNVYFYKNEIFRMVGDKLVIIYCPHPTLLIPPVTDEKVRRIKPLTIHDPKLKELPPYNLVNILTGNLLDQNCKCWFSKEFSLMTLPEDRSFSNWCLIPNK